MRTFFFLACGVCLIAGGVATRTQSLPDWTSVENETMRHYQALLRLDTSNPPGNERLVVDYLAGVLTREGIPFEIRAGDRDRPNLVARLKGSGRKRPLLMMAHTDVVPVDAAKWSHPPFGAVREGGYVYARGALDDKDNLTAGLMTLLLLKRAGAPLAVMSFCLAKPARKAAPRLASS